MLRSVFAAIIGVCVGALVIFGVEFLGHAVFPTTVAIDRNDPEQMRRLVAATPLGAKLFVAAGWFFGALFGGIAALAIARRWAPVAWLVAATVLGLSLTNFLAIPHPLWMIACAVIGCGLAGAAAIVVMRGAYGPPPAPPEKPFS